VLDPTFDLTLLSDRAKLHHLFGDGFIEKNTVDHVASGIVQFPKLARECFCIRI